VNISLSLGIISFVSIGPAYFMIVQYGENQVEQADSINESFIEDIDVIAEIEEQEEQITVQQIDSLEPVIQLPTIFINGVDPEDQQSESSLGTYRTKTTVTKNGAGKDTEKISELEKNQQQMLQEMTTMKTMIQELSEQSRKFSGNKSTRF
jgi:hypothetical protein